MASMTICTLRDASEWSSDDTNMHNVEIEIQHSRLQRQFPSAGLTTTPVSQ